MATLTVTTAADTTDAADGVLSLREAIALANAAAGDDTITFDGALAAQTIVLTQGELLVDNASAEDTGGLVIDGDLDDDSVPDITISGSDASRVLHIVGGDMESDRTVVLEGLGIAHGATTYGNGEGAGLLARNVDLAIAGCDISDNRAVTAGGGGIYVVGGALAISNSSINNNSAVIYGYDTENSAPGGGIFARVETLALTGCSIEHNASEDGGGVFVLANSTSITNCKFIGNGASYSGGGIKASGGDLAISNTIIGENRGGSGGGISKAGGSLLIFDTKINENRTGNHIDEYFSYNGGGGGLFATDCVVSIGRTMIQDNAVMYENTFGAGGGISTKGGSLAITDSAIVNNAGNAGGGLYTYSTSVMLSNDTISENYVRMTYGNSQGGGLSTYGGSVDIRNSTITDNRAVGYSVYVPGVDQSYQYVIGGGINAIKVLPTLTNSIFAGNRTISESSISADPAFADIAGTILSNGHNLFGQSAVDGSIAGDLLGIADPKLGALADNGGPTKTIALLPGSPAIDAGADANAGTAYDQRGPDFHRISGAHVDIGAFEVQQVLPSPFTDGDDMVDLNTLRLTDYLGTRVTDARGGDDVVTLSVTQNLDVAFHGGGGDDTLTGAEASDVMLGDAGDDVVLGAGGEDVLEGGVGADALLGQDGQDRLGGGNGDDGLAGQDGNDLLDGSDSGDDHLDGGAGDDTLATGQGNDSATGDDGADVFVLRPGGAGVDRIVDFAPGTDHLRSDTSLDEASLLATATEADGDTILRLGPDDFVIVQGVTGIAADWFA